MRHFKGIQYQVVNRSKGTPSKSANETEKSIILNYPCTNSYDCTPYVVLFPSGTYKFELWGAQGGNGRYLNSNEIREDSGGKGAYASGTIFLEGLHTFYFFIGGKGEDQIYTGSIAAKGGYNGGGTGGVDKADGTLPESSAGGGGSTDVRFYPDDSLKALKSRIIVAGAGAGSCSIDDNIDTNTYIAGDGGTLSGTSASSFAIPGNQTYGLFGKGQDGLSFGRSSYPSGGSTGGSGSGYYGGITFDGKHSGISFEIGGSGGSSYISGYTLCDSVLNDNSDPPLHSGDNIHYSTYYFKDPVMKMRGSPNFTSPQGTSEFGHKGNGAVKITIIEVHGRILQRCTMKMIRQAPNISLLGMIIIMRSQR